MKGYAAYRSPPRPGVAFKRVRGDPDDNDDVLLPFNGPFPPVGTVLSKELKFYDTWLTSHEPSYAGDLSNGIVSVNANEATPFSPIRGDTYEMRDGKFCRVVSWQFKGTCIVFRRSNGTVPPSACKLFIALVKDKSCNGVQCSASDIFVNHSSNSAQLMNLLRSAVHGDRFEVLRSDVFDLDAQTLTYVDPVAPDETMYAGKAVCFEYFVPLHCGVSFNAGNAAHVISTIIDTAFHVVAFTYDQVPVFPENVARFYLSYQSRFRFYSDK